MTRHLILCAAVVLLSMGFPGCGPHPGIPGPGEPGGQPSRMHHGPNARHHGPGTPPPHESRHHGPGTKPHNFEALHHGRGGHWPVPPEAAGRPNPIAPTSESIERGKTLYLANCAPCHGPGGRGNGPRIAKLKSRPADLALMAGHHSPGNLAWKISHGRGEMPEWRKTLTQDEIWDVVNYIRILAGQ